MRRFFGILFWLIGVALTGSYAQFVDVTTQNIPQAGGDAQWGDMDNDGDLDLVVLGFDNEIPVCRISYNQGDGSFKPGSQLGLLGLSGKPSIALGDYNKDGYTDFAIAGRSAELNKDGERILKTMIYKNSGAGLFILVNDVLTGLMDCELEWGDVDNDGDPDLLGSGFSNFQDGTTAGIIFRNLGNDVFEEVKLPVGVGNGTMTLGDYDQDGDLDIAAVGRTGPSFSEYFYAAVLENMGDLEFEIRDYGFTPFWYASAIWCDLDNDSDLDLIMSGVDDTISEWLYIYENDINGSDQFIKHGPYGNFYDGKIAVGDLNHDQLTDFVIVGYTQSGGDIPQAWVYESLGDFNFQTMQQLEGLGLSVDLGDFNMDSKLDIVMTGSTVDEIYASRLYKNEHPGLPLIPSVPSNLQSSIDGNDVVLSWSDSDTTSNTYHVMLHGPDGPVVLPDVNPDGTLSIFQGGNAGLNQFMNIIGLPKGIYSWSALALNGSYAISPFSAESFFEITESLPPPPTPFEIANIRVYDPFRVKRGNFFIADVNNDRKYDLLIQNGENQYDDDEETLLLWDNDRYEKSIYFTSNYGDTKIRDLNGDGYLDLINKSGLFMNLRGNEFSLLRITSGEESAYGFHAADFDMDGDYDLMNLNQPLLYWNAYPSLDNLHNDDPDRIDMNYQRYGGSEENYLDVQLEMDWDGDGINELIDYEYGYTKIINPRNSFLFEEEFTGVENTLSSYSHIPQYVDFDGDGDLDIVAGNVDYGYQGGDAGVFLIFYELEGGEYVQKSKLFLSSLLSDFPVFEDVYSPVSLDFGDIDNDGTPEFLFSFYILREDFFSGETNETQYTFLIDRDPTNEEFIIMDQYDARIARFLDYDGDHDLDMIMMQPFALYLNTTDPVVDLSPPDHVKGSFHNDTLIYTWNYERPFESFNIQFEYAPFHAPDQRTVIMSSHSHEDGMRKILEHGNSSVSMIHKFTHLKEGMYYFKVQAITPGKIGTTFSLEDTISFDRFDYVSIPTIDDYQKHILDMDMDGDMDIMFSGLNYETWEYSANWQENIDGHFSADLKPVLVDGLSNFEIMSIIDVNSDGKLDIIFNRDDVTSGVGIQLNDGTFTLDPYYTGIAFDSVYLDYAEEWFFQYSFPVFFDGDNDGDMDLVKSDISGLNLIYFENEGYEFVTRDTLLSSNQDYSLEAIAAFDANNDGYKDFLISDRNEPISLRLVYNGPEGFGKRSDIIVSNILATWWGTQLVNVNNDEFLDINLLNNTILNIQGVITQPIPNQSLSQSEWPIDINNDGWTDRVDQENGAYLLNKGTDQFFPYFVFGRIQPTHFSINFADFDQNGTLNLLLQGDGLLDGNYSSFTFSIEDKYTKPNTDPIPPKGLSSLALKDIAELTWEAGEDSETPSDGLFYNLYLRSEDDTVIHPLATKDGYKFMNDMGNARNVRKFIVTDLRDGTYYWAVQTIDNGYANSSFSEEASFEIFVGPEIVSGMTSICQADEATYTVSPAGYDYEWTFTGGVLTGQSSNDVTIKWGDPGDHWLIVENLEFGRRDSLKITVRNKPEGFFTYGDNLGINANILFDDSVSADVVSRAWDFGDGDTSDEADPVHVYTSSGIYDVALTVENNVNCSMTYADEILVENFIPVQVANILTPNGDSKNDFLYIENIERYPDNELRVLNAWGQQVYYRKGYANDWFGDSGGNTIEAGSYVVILTINNPKKEIRATINVLR